MKKGEWVEKEINEARRRLGFRLEEVALDFTEQICKQMKKLEISKADLAKSLNTSRAYVTNVLSGTYYKNLTLKTMVSLAMALDSDIEIKVKPEAKSHVIAHTPETAFMSLQTSPQTWLGGDIQNKESFDGKNIAEAA